jgi:bisphosphoglycerate-dependent phosphoglycerate mutase
MSTGGRAAATECLADVVERMLPYWYDEIVPGAARKA